MCVAYGEVHEIPVCGVWMCCMWEDVFMCGMCEMGEDICSVYVWCGGVGVYVVWGIHGVCVGIHMVYVGHTYICDIGTKCASMWGMCVCQVCMRDTLPQLWPGLLCIVESF